MGSRGPGDARLWNPNTWKRECGVGIMPQVQSIRLVTPGRGTPKLYKWMGAASVISISYKNFPRSPRLRTVMPQRKWGIPATLASPPAPHPRHTGDPGDPGQGLLCPGPYGKPAAGVRGARDEPLLRPLLLVTEQPSQGRRLNCSLLSRAKGTRDPERLPLTLRGPKQREEEEGRRA